MGTYADNTVVIKILGSVLTDIRNIECEFLHTTLGFPDFRKVLVHVN